jgi:hypothetical protein
MKILEFSELIRAKSGTSADISITKETQYAGLCWTYAMEVNTSSKSAHSEMKKI